MPAQIAVTLWLTMLLAIPAPSTEQAQITTLTAIAAAQQQQIAGLERRVHKLERKVQDLDDIVQASSSCGCDVQPEQ